MRTPRWFILFALLLSGCVTTTLRDGKPVETPAAETGGFAQGKTAAVTQGNTNVRVNLVPRKDNPALYEYNLAEVYPKTVYSKLGFKTGDTILSVDGKSVQTMEDAISLPARLSSGDFSKILIRRKGKNLLLQAKN